jgi:hypothetical protein
MSPSQLVIAVDYSLSNSALASFSSAIMVGRSSYKVDVTCSKRDSLILRYFYIYFLSNSDAYLRCIAFCSKDWIIAFSLSFRSNTSISNLFVNLSSIAYSFCNWSFDSASYSLLFWICPLFTCSTLACKSEASFSKPTTYCFVCSMAILTFFLVILQCYDRCTTVCFTESLLKR